MSEPHVLIGTEWRPLDGSPPPSYVSGEVAGYGCDTGCMGHVIYLVNGDGTREQLGSFEFTEEAARAHAVKHGERLGLPVLFEPREWDE